MRTCEDVQCLCWTLRCSQMAFPSYNLFWASSSLTSRASPSCLRKVRVIGRNGEVWKYFYYYDGAISYIIQMTSLDVVAVTRLLREYTLGPYTTFGPITLLSFFQDFCGPNPEPQSNDSSPELSEIFWSCGLKAGDCYHSCFGFGLVEEVLRLSIVCCY